MFNIYMAYYTQHGTECYKKNIQNIALPHIYL